MSMRETPAYVDLCILVDNELAAHLLLAADRRNDCVPENIECISPEQFSEMAKDGSLPDNYGIETINQEGFECIDSNDLGIDTGVICNFTGSFYHLDDDGETSWNYEDTFYDDVVVYIGAPKQPSVFKAAYNDMDELEKVFRSLLVELGCQIRPDYDVRSKIGRIVGTVYG